MPIFFKSFNHKWVLNFVKGFFCIYLDYHTVFILQFVNMVYHIDWFVYIEEYVRSWNKPQLDHDVWAFWCGAEFCLLKFCCGFLHPLVINIISPVVLVILACSFFFCVIFVWFWYQSDGGLVEWVWKCSFLWNFLEEF